MFKKTTCTYFPQLYIIPATQVGQFLYEKLFKVVGEGETAQVQIQLWTLLNSVTQ